MVYNASHYVHLTVFTEWKNHRYCNMPYKEYLFMHSTQQGELLKCFVYDGLTTLISNVRRHPFLNDTLELNKDTPWLIRTLDQS